MDMSLERYLKVRKCMQQRQTDLTVVMDNVHKAHNLAAIARTCDAVGIAEIYAATESDEIVLTQNASSGSERWLDVTCYKQINDIFNKLRKNNFQILTAHFDDKAIDFRKIDYTIPTAIVVGQELEGLSPQVVAQADHSIIIPMYGMVQSLNVSVATAIILYEAQRQRELAGLYKKVHLTEQQINKLIFEKCYPRVAQLYRDRNENYPSLDENGDIIY